MGSEFLQIRIIRDLVSMNNGSYIKSRSISAEMRGFEILQRILSCTWHDVSERLLRMSMMMMESIHSMPLLLFPLNNNDRRRGFKK